MKNDIDWARVDQAYEEQFGETPQQTAARYRRKTVNDNRIALVIFVVIIITVILSIIV